MLATVLAQSNQGSSVQLTLMILDLSELQTPRWGLSTPVEEFLYFWWEKRRSDDFPASGSAPLVSSPFRTVAQK